MDPAARFSPHQGAASTPAILPRRTTSLSRRLRSLRAAASPCRQAARTRSRLARSRSPGPRSRRGDTSSRPRPPRTRSGDASPRSRAPRSPTGPSNRARDRSGALLAAPTRLRRARERDLATPIHDRSRALADSVAQTTQVSQLARHELRDTARGLPQQCKSGSISAQSPTGERDMAEVSRATATKLANGSAVVSAIEVQGMRIAGRARAALFGDNPDAPDLEALVTQLGMTLKLQNEDLRRYEAEYLAERTDDDAVRAARDEALANGTTVYVNIKGLVSAAFGARYAARVGLGGATERRPDLFAAQARNAQRLLTDVPPPRLAARRRGHRRRRARRPDRRRGEPARAGPTRPRPRGPGEPAGDDPPRRSGRALGPGLRLRRQHHGRDGQGGGRGRPGGSAAADGPPPGGAGGADGGGGSERADAGGAGFPRSLPSARRSAWSPPHSVVETFWTELRSFRC